MITLGEQNKIRYGRYQVMAKETLSIPNISCGHCVMAIKNELNQMEGVKAVEGNPVNKTITVEWESPATGEKIRGALKEINYPAA
jgi:copper chaperone CopZ